MGKTRVGLATTNFFSSFQEFLPDLRVVGKNLATLDSLDLVIFPGGEDIHPKLYNQDFAGARGVNIDRDTTEVAVFHQCVARNIPIVGVCRGHQLINALLGGSLVQNIKPGHGSNHEIIWVQDSPLAKVYPSRVNSLHHQGYTNDEMAWDLAALAVEPETGIVEVAEGKNVLSVQFHPEFLDYDVSKGFFDYILSWANRR